MSTSETKTYFGLDFSTQQAPLLTQYKEGEQDWAALTKLAAVSNVRSTIKVATIKIIPQYRELKGVIVNDQLKIIHESSVQFDTALPEFRTQSGVVRHDKQTVTAPVLMWVKALDLLLDQLRVGGADFSQVAAVSGSAQQHGTVYWQSGAEETLNSLDPDSFLHTQLASAFAVTSSPVWIDCSTSAQCRHLEDAVGGPQRLAEITGSRAYERFSAAQIMKFAQTKPSTYINTERISLVSSFACSLFLGKYAPIDWSDGSGMNLLDICSKQWSPECLQACAEELSSRLGAPVASHSDLGPVSEYMVERHGFSPSCRVVVFTGDNPASLAGMRLRSGDIAVSLGTSDTLFLSLPRPTTLPEGHILVNPTDRDAYMALLCFKNGSLTRERIRNWIADRSWDEFNNLLNSTPRGNFGNFGLYYDAQEIIPFVQGDYRWDRADNAVGKFSRETEVRALLEGQCIAKRAHAEDLGFVTDKDTRILATGGGSNNKHLLQVLADSFNANVYTLEAANSAVLGAAYLAKYGLMCSSGCSFNDITDCLPPPTLVVQPYSDADQIYRPMLERYRSFIQEIRKTS